MPANQRGVSFYQSGWAGATTVTRTSTSATSVVTPVSPTSPIRYALQILAAGKALIDDSFKISISSTGVITFFCDEGFSIAFTNNAGTRIGFASASYASASTYTGETVSSASFFPYSEDVFFYTNKIRKPMVDGVATRQGGVWNRTPGTDHENPDLSFSVLRSDVLSFVECYSQLGDVGKLDLVDDSNVLTVFFCGGMTVNEQSALTGWSEITIEVAS